MQSRRAFVIRAAATTAAFATVSPARAQDKGQVVIAAAGGTWQDALREAIFKPFEKATGIKVVEAVGSNVAKLRTMVGSGNQEWDISEQTGSIEYLANEGLLERINYAAMDRAVFTDIPKEFLQPSGVAITVYALVLGFNTSKYTQTTAPKNWAEFWDVKRFPGPRIMYSGGTDTPPIEIALVADGVAPDKLYPLDFNRAYKSLARIKPAVLKFATGGAMLTEALVSGEAAIGLTSYGRMKLAKDQGAPVDFTLNQAMTEPNWWVIPKGAKNVANAHKFIEFASRPEIQAALAKLFLAGPVNRKAFDLIPVDRAQQLPTYPANYAKTIHIDRGWWFKKEASGKTNFDTNLALWNQFSMQK